jgi:DNA-binding MarR family transcriptional regulator
MVTNHYPVGVEAATTESQPLSKDLPVGVLLSRLGGETMGRYRRALKPLELNAQHYVVLKQLDAIGTASQAALAEALGLDYSNLATITGELAERGLIERYRHESDKRRYVVELSESGSKLIEEADQAVAEGEQLFVESLEPGEQEQLWRLLRKVADAAQLCPRERGSDNCNLQTGEEC